MFTLENVHPDAVVYLKKQLELNKVTVTSPNAASQTFHFIGHGVTGNAAFNGTELTVNITSKPFFVSEEAIEYSFTAYVENWNITHPDEAITVTEQSSEATEQKASKVNEGN